MSGLAPSTLAKNTIAGSPVYNSTTLISWFRFGWKNKAKTSAGNSQSCASVGRMFLSAAGGRLTVPETIWCRNLQVPKPDTQPQTDRGSIVRQKIKWPIWIGYSYVTPTDRQFKPKVLFTHAIANVCLVTRELLGMGLLVPPEYTFEGASNQENPRNGQLPGFQGRHNITHDLGSDKSQRTICDSDTRRTCLLYTSRCV